MTHQHGSRPRILVAEPEPDIQFLYKSFLHDWDLEIVESGTGCLRAATRDGRASGEYHDLIVIDSHVKDGMIETLRRLRELLPYQHVVVTSTTDPDALRRQLTGAGMSDQANLGFIQKPFMSSDLLSLLRARKPRVGSAQLTDHILAIYEDQEQELAEAISFVKRAVPNNETALFILREDINVEAVKERIARCGLDVDSLVRDGSLIFTKNVDWYLPDGRMDKQRLLAQWNRLVETCVRSGKNGVRAFCMMDCMFEHNLESESVDYEVDYPPKLDIALVPICAYRKQDIDRLSDDQKRRLLTCHNKVWT